MPSAGTATLLTSLWIGTAPSLAWRSTGSSSYGTVRTWNLVVWLQVQSTCGLLSAEDRSPTGPLLRR